MDHLGALAEFASKATVPDDVRDKAALVLADTLGAILGGAAETEVAALTDRLCETAPGHASVLGRGLGAEPRTAALLNGTAGTALEMDEGNQFCKGHPAIHVIPAVLAEAAAGHVPGRTLLEAIAVGYDVAARVGTATALRPSMHPHGTWGATGAAAAVLRLRGADGAAMRDALNMAATLGLTTSRRTMLEGGTVRNVFAGVSNQMGLLVADLAAAGFSGDREGVAEVFGKVASDRFDDGALSDDLGGRWDIMRNYFKLHACCRFNHAALDALDTLLAEAGNVPPDDIEAITVETYALAVELDDPAPRNVLAAKFSLPFAVATRVLTGRTTVESFSSDRVRDGAIRALAARVRVCEDSAMTARLPDRRPARVTLVTSGGRSFSAETGTNRGDWADPYTEADLLAKFRSLAARLWGPDAAEALWTSARGLDAADETSTLMACLAHTPGTGATARVPA